MRDEKKNYGNDKSGGKVGNTIPVLKNVYNSNVGKRALERAGKNKNLHGHVNEILTCDQYNRKLSSIVKNTKATLTKSPVAQRDDIVIKNGKKRIVSRMQLKDTVGGIKKTVKQVEDGKYRRTNLVGTKETKEAFDKAVSVRNKNGANITQKMSSNGISSEKTKLIAAQVSGGNISKCKSAIKHQAKKSGRQAAVITMGIEAISNGKKVIEGKEKIGEAATKVAKEGGISCACAMVSDTTGTTTTILLAPSLGPAASVVGIAAGTAAGMATDKIIRKTGEKLGEIAMKK